MNTQHTKPDRIIPLSEFLELTGLSRTTAWRLNREGKLPVAIIIDGRRIGYRESAYHEWLQANTSENSQRNNRSSR